MRDYGEDDGFIIDNTLWWEYYNNLINEMLDKIDKKIFTEEDMSRFYGDFGFGPKSYGKSFIANGREKIEPLFLFLSDIDIPAEQKIREVEAFMICDYRVIGLPRRST